MPRMIYSFVASSVLLVTVAIRAAEIKLPQSPKIKEEVALLKSCQPLKCPVFYVQVLDRTFPIPSRYRVSFSGSEGRSLKLTSPVPEFSSLENAMAGEEISGLIAIGSIEEMKKSERLGNLKFDYQETIDGIDLLSVSLSAGPGAIPSRVVFLVGTKDYIQIGDENEQLPRLLVDISRRVREFHK